MDHSGISGLDSAHECGFCREVVFLLGGSVSIHLVEMEKGREAGCKLFQFFLHQQPVPTFGDPDTLPEPTWKCTDSGIVDFRWMKDGKAFENTDKVPILPSTLFPERGSPLSKQLNAKPLESDPGSVKSIQRLRRWVRRCEKKHDKCSELRSKLHGSGGPTRLIAVGKDHSTHVSIYLNKDRSPVEYVALSYSWGGDQPSMTVCANLDKRCKGLALDELPKTIRDAVVITRELRLPYLWVDAMCILQDDKADQDREMEFMHRMYSGAFLTLEAARANNSDEGFLQGRNLEEGYGMIFKVHCRRRKGEPPQPCNLSANSLEITYEEPIDSRAWTHQEHYLSFRTLRFGGRQTVWQCPYRLEVDGGLKYVWKPSSDTQFTGRIADKPYEYSLNDLDHKYELSWVLESWQHLVHQYSRRSLKHRSDKLPAFAATATLFGECLRLGPEEYVAGLWLFDINMQLRWRRPIDIEWSKWEHGKLGPSWSWISVDGPVEYESPRREPCQGTLKVGRPEIRLESPRLPYGKIESARLPVHGYLRVLLVCDWTSFWDIDSDRRPEPILLDAYWDNFEERPDEGDQPREVWCLEIDAEDQKNGAKKLCGLLLAKAGDDIYKRLGYFEADDTRLRSRLRLSGYKDIVLE